MPALPRWMNLYIPQEIKNSLKKRATPTFERYAAMLRNYQTKDLVNESAAEFRTRVEAFSSLKDASMEGLSETDGQRHYAIDFHWGHNHDFGEFAVQGRWGDRPATLMATLVDKFGELPADLTGMKVLDIGAWTGGTSLILHAMGAEVLAVEEVRKYADCINYWSHAFGLERLEARAVSLFECTGEELQDAFDYVLYPGVLYHVTDPVLSLRILYNCLKPGGRILVETAAHASSQPVMRIEGPPGYNWFFPSPKALRRMLESVGFDDIRVHGVSWGGRAFAFGTRGEVHKEIIRAGLAMPRIR